MVILNEPLVVIGTPVTDIPVPAMAEIDVTVPTLTEPPRLVVEPLIVMLEFCSAALVILPPVIDTELEFWDAIVPNVSQAVA